MNRSILLTIVRRAEAMAAGPGADAPGDGLLLNRFVQDRDDAAFGTLLARHAPMVWGVCRGLLPCDADAEDAFQATFLALLRGAKSIRETKSIAPWLHGTATRIAKKSRLSNGRRNTRERKWARHEAAPNPVGEATWDQAHLAVHEEIAALPATLRTAFVLCVLEGDRHHDAAAKLGVPIGTVSARVSRARQKLLDRLNARGIAPVAMASALVAGPSAVPAALLESVRLSVSDGFTTAGSSVVHLATTATEGTTMKTKLLAAAIMIAGAIGTTGGSAWINKAGGQLPPAPAVAAPATPTAPRYPVVGEPVPGAYQPPVPTGAPAAYYAPPAASRAAWEHLTVNRPKTTKGFQDMLKSRSNEGWEYVGSETFGEGDETTVLSVFKRPIRATYATTPDVTSPVPASAYAPATIPPAPNTTMPRYEFPSTTAPVPGVHPPVQPGPGAAVPRYDNPALPRTAPASNSNSFTQPGAAIPRFEAPKTPAPFATPSFPRATTPSSSERSLIPSPNVTLPDALRSNQQTKIVRLKTLAAADVAAVISQYLQVHQPDQKSMGIVAEPVSNSLLITTPDAKSMEDLTRIIGELDASPKSESKPAATPTTKPKPAPSTPRSATPPGAQPKPTAPPTADDSPLLVPSTVGKTEVVQLRNIAVADVEKSLNAYLKAQPLDDLKRVHIATDLRTNSLTISAPKDQSVKAILRLVRAMDVEPDISDSLTPAQKRFQNKEGDSVMIAMKHADAVAVAKSIQAAWDKDKRAQDNTIDIAADATSNSIYLASTNPGLFKEYRDKIQESDKPAKREANR